MLTKKEWNLLINTMISEYNNNGTSPRFREMSEIILKNASPEQIIIVASRVKGFDKSRSSDIVLKNGTPAQNFEMACISGSKSKNHRYKIIESGDIDLNIKAGKHIQDEFRDEFVNLHGKIVLKGSAYQNFTYLKHNKAKNLNRKAHFDRIIESKDVHFNYICAKEIPDAPVLKHGEVVAKSREITTNISFARLPKADRDMHLDIVCKYGDAYSCYDVVSEFENINLSKFLSRIFLSDDNEVKYLTIKWLKDKKLLSRYKKIFVVEQFINDLKAGKIELDKDLIQ